MKINLSKTIDFLGENISFETAEKLPDFEFNGTQYRVLAPITVNGFYRADKNTITVTADIEAVLSVPCDRCLVDTEISVKTAMSDVFSRTGEDEEIYHFNGHDLVIDRAVMDNVVLSLPMHVLCKADCKGLCPHCGEDLNKDSCNCEIEMKKANSPFASLDGLFSEE
ncbi:MAG: DUF177 domain-containing protein [Eubacteriales bacterium]